MQVLEFPLRTGRAVVFLQQGLQVAQERRAAADDHLQQQRLAFLERHAAIAAHRLVAPARRHADVVHRVSGLVQRAEQTGERVCGIVARGEPQVADHALGEWMLALVEPSLVEGKSDRLHDLDHEAALFRGAKAAGDRQQRLLLLLFERFADHARQAARQGLEDRVDVRGAHAGAEFIDQRVVGREVQRLAKQRCLVAHQQQHLLEVRREQRIVVVAARGQPLALGDRRGARQPRDQRHGRGNGVIALAAHLAQVRDLPVLEPAQIRLRTIEQPRDLGRGQQRVVLGLERRDLFTTQFRAAARHHDRRVPAQQRQCATEGMQPAPFLLELLVRGRGHSLLGVLGGRRNSTSPKLPGGVPVRYLSL